MNPQSISETWVYLSASPLIGLTLTLLAYQLSLWLYKRSGHRAWANPVLVAIFLITLFLWATGTPYKHYFDGAQFVRGRRELRVGGEGKVERRLEAQGPGGVAHGGGNDRHVGFGSRRPGQHGQGADQRKRKA